MAASVLASTGLLPGNRTRDHENFGLKFRSENKEFNSDEKVQIYRRTNCLCPERTPVRYQSRGNCPKAGHIASDLLLLARAVWLAERPRSQGIKATERREFQIKAVGGEIEPCSSSSTTEADWIAAPASGSPCAYCLTRRRTEVGAIFFSRPIC